MRTSFIHRYPVASFYILAFALGAAAVYLVVQGVLPRSLALASVLSASIAGVIMTVAEDGILGLKLMLNRLRNWQVRIGYWFFSVLFLLPVIILGSLFNPFFNGDSPYFNNITLSFEILPMFIGFLVIAGIGQELGWTGFLMPRLQSRFSALNSCVIRAILVGFWHLPLLFFSWLKHPALMDFPYSGWITQKGFLVAVATLILVFLIPWSILYNWVFNNTQGSILLVAVLHGSEVCVAYWMVTTGINPGNLDNYWGYGAVLLLTAIILILTNGANDLSRKWSRIVHPPSYR